MIHQELRFYMKCRSFSDDERAISMLHCYLHRILQHIFIACDEKLAWQAPFSQQMRAHLLTASFYARHAPDRGHPEEECGIVPISRNMFEEFLQPVSPQEAFQADPHLVNFVWRLQHLSSLPQLFRLMPRGALLQVVHLGKSPDGRGELFDLYREHPDRSRWTYLNPHLAELFPTCQVEGLPRFCVPALPGVCGGMLFVVALESRIWGTSPVYHCVLSDW